MLVTVQTYEEIALGDPERQWELHRGVLREKPGMSVEHNHVQRELYGHLFDQLDRTRFKISANASRLGFSDDVYYIPDLVVIPAAFVTALRSRRDALEVYSDPMPLVVEVWSPSTGTYDVDTKIPAYQERGDFEIWRLHPFEGTLIAWRRRPDGGYDRTIHRSGTVQPAALPNVTIDLDALFA